MSAWWDGLTALQKFLYFIAAPSTIVMLIQTVMLILGWGGGHGDAAGGGPIEGGVGHELPHEAVVAGHSTIGHAGVIPGVQESTAGGAAAEHSEVTDQVDSAVFHLFSLRSILSFLVVFGWVGIAMAANSAIPAVVIILVSFLAGTAALFLTAWMFYAIQKLQYSGNVRLANAVGLEAEVYIPVPAEHKGTGKVNLLLQERWLECDAVTLGQEALRTGQLVRVTGLQGGATLIVEPMK